MPEEQTVQPEEQKEQQQNQSSENNSSNQSVTEQEALDNSKNPERTKEFIDKLKEENKRYKNVLDSLKPSQEEQRNQPQQQQQTQAPSANQFSHLNQQDVNNVFQSMVDQDGYLDGNKLMQTLEQMNRRAIDAEQRAQRVEEHIRRKEVAETEAQKTQQMKQVHEKYPELDPESEDFNSDFYDAVRNELIGQMMEGKEDAMLAADKWANRMDMTRKEKEKVEKTNNQKAQINAVRPRSPMMKGYYEKEEQQALIQQVRQGKKGSIAEALRRIGQ